MASDGEKLTAWAACVERGRAASLGHLRNCQQVELLARGDELWLRGPEASASLRQLLAAIPCQERYRVDSQGRLIPHGKRLPTGRMPDGPWAQISQFMVPRFESAAFPATHPAGASFRLVPSTAVRPDAALLTELAAWRHFGEQASELRLQVLRFALAADGRVLVVGTPLPTLPGTPLHTAGPLLIPAGWQCMPALAAQLLPSLLALSGDDVAILHGDGSCEVVREDGFVTASRSAIRLSGEESAHG